jgi:hypothetical protein
MGSSTKLMPTLNEKFPPPQGTDNQVATSLLLACAITILLALALTLYGLARSRPAAGSAAA